MIIDTLTISKDEGLFGIKTFSFPFSNKTLIRSSENSVGKSSLLRFLLFGLGFKVPSTAGLNMFLYKVDVTFNNNNGKFISSRSVDRVILFNENKEIINTYNLRNANETMSLMEFIFGYNIPKVYENLLGCIFIEQDSGWKISNHGTVLSYNKFNALSLVSTLNEKSISLLDEQIKRLRIEQNKYKSLLHLMEQTDNQSKTFAENNDIKFNADFQKLKDRQSYLLSRRSDLKNSISDINTIICDNEKLGELIEKYSIIVKLPGVDRFVLKKENIEPFNSTNAILIAKLNDFNSELSIIEDELYTIRFKMNKTDLNFSIESISDSAVKNLREANIDSQKLKTIVSDLGKDIYALKKQRNEYISENNNFYNLLNRLISKRLDEYNCNNLIVGDFITKDNSSFSGIQAYNITLCYRLALNDFLSEVFSISLPLIIDSPGNGERVNINFNDLLSKVLKNSNQIIISTTEEINKKNNDQFTTEIEAYGRIFEGKYRINKDI